MKGRPSDWTRVVSEHAHDTPAFMVSGAHPSCMAMAQYEVRFIDRWMTRATLDVLPATVPSSWFMGVLVCPGDDLTALAVWMSEHGGDRVRFYLHPHARPGQLAPVRDAGHELRHVRPERFATFGALHKRLGLDLSDQTYEDFRP